MKRVISLVVVLLMLSSLFVYADSSFNDIDDSWAKDYIVKAADLNLINGKPDNNFEPKSEVTKLDALLMLTRLYNIDEETEEKMLAKNNSFLTEITDGKDQWAYNELSQAIELGIISKTGLRNMYEDSSIKKSATREQICILLAKALYMQDDVKNLDGKVYTMPFGDTSKISTEARAYVYVIYKANIVSGNSDGDFQPQGSLLREQLAKVICLAYEKVQDESVEPQYESFEEFENVTGLIKDIKTNSIETTITLDVDGSEDDRIIRVVKESTSITVDDEKSSVDKLAVGMHTSCSVSEDTAVAKTLNVDTSFSTKEGIVTGVWFSSNPMKLVIENENKESVTYEIDANVPVTVDGKSIVFKELVKSDKVVLTMQGDKVSKIDSTSRVLTYVGTISEIVYDFPIKLIIKDSNDKTEEFEYIEEPVVEKNDIKTTFDSLSVGDKVTVSTTYEELTAITAESNTQEGFGGVVKEITIGDINKIKLMDNDGEIKEYTVAKDANVNVLNQAASIYDLRLGYKVDVSFNGEIISSITAKETESSQEITGKIVYVNADKNLLMLQVIDDKNNKEIIYSYLNNDTTLMNLKGTRLYLKNLDMGENVLCVGAYSGGTFNAVSVIVK